MAGKIVYSGETSGGLDPETGFLTSQLMSQQADRH